MYKQGLVLKNQYVLICHKSQTERQFLVLENLTEKIIKSIKTEIFRKLLLNNQ